MNDNRGSYRSGPVTIDNAALFTDLYELTMAATYFAEQMNEQATFSLFVRRLPKNRSFLIAAGLHDVIQFLNTFSFADDAIDFLESMRRFDTAFLEHLRTVRFTGSVRAIPEGTIAFADEPLLEITAPIIEAQLVETAVLNLCHFQTVMCSKAARTVLAARGKPVVEFGLRRTPGLHSGLAAARCAYIAGCTMSSNVLAGMYDDIPPTGTMAHSFITAFENELSAFRAFAKAFPTHTTLLLDTYDTEQGAHKAVAIAREMQKSGHALSAVRLDNGHLLTLSRCVRNTLDAANLHGVRILASGGLDEYHVDSLLRSGAPIDAFGVGTKMNVSDDVPYLDMAYKLVRYNGRNVLKLSAGKETWTGEKQVFRVVNADGRFRTDIIGLLEEQADPPASATPLLQTVMRDGQPVSIPPTLESVRRWCAQQVQAVKNDHNPLETADAYPVLYSDRLRNTQESVKSEVTERELHSNLHPAEPPDSPSYDPRALFSQT